MSTDSYCFLETYIQQLQCQNTTKIFLNVDQPTLSPFKDGSTYPVSCQRWNHSLSKSVPSIRGNQHQSLIILCVKTTLDNLIEAMNIHSNLRKFSSFTHDLGNH